MARRFITVAVAVLVLNWMGVGRDPAEVGAPGAAIRVTDSWMPVGEPLSGEQVAGELIVDLRDDATAEEVAAIESRYGVDLEENGPASRDVRWMRARVAPGSERAVREALAKDASVESVEQNQIYKALGVPNDPLYKFQWHMDQIQGPAAWDHGAGEGAVVAVIDTGVAYEDHDRFKQARDLKGTKFVPGWDFVHRHGHPNDDHAHGTHVAGTIAQATNNNEGVAGVAHRAAIMPIKVLSAQGSGTVADIAESIKWAADHGADVINMSLGGSGFSRVLKDACDYAKKKGVAVVCAAGNNGREKVSYPAAYPACIAVSATRFDEEVTWYSNYGKEICVAAPGGDTRVDQNGDGYPDGVLQNTILRGDPGDDGYELFQGTSMASPHAAAVAALIVSQGVRKDPDQLRKILEKTARPKGSGRGDIKYGAGIIDASAAQRMAREQVAFRRSIQLGGLALLTAWGAPVVWSRCLLAAIPALLAAAGLFFLPWGGFLSQPLPAWDVWLFGAATPGNPLGYSALLPLATMVFFWGRPRLRLVAAGLAVGTAAHLLDSALFGAVDVAWVPGAGVLDFLWLGLNAALALWFARIALMAGGRR